MPWWGWALLGIGAWVVGGVVVGLVLGAAIRLADRGGPRWGDTPRHTDPP